MSNIDHVKVLIVGSGVSGLAAGKHLTENNIECLIVEAQDYFGGRVCTVEAVPDVLVELGAQYVLNDSNDVVFQFFNELDCLTDKQDKVDFFLTSKRERIDTDLVQRVWMNRLEALADTNQIPTENSLSERYTQRLSSIVDNHSLRSTFVDWLVKVVDEGGWPSVSDDWRQSKRSLRPFINHLRSNILEKQLRLNTEVTKVKYIAKDHRLTVELFNALDKKTTSTLTCDHIIWTTSLGYLKDNFNRIFANESELIVEKEQAITNLPFCTANKILLVYANTIEFWPNAAADIYLLRDRDAPTKLNEEDLIFIRSHNVDLDKAQLILDKLFYIAPSNEYRVLTCWVGGQAALVAEEISETVLGYLCHNVICQYLVGAAKTDRPIRTIRTRWHSNQFMCGSYSGFLPQTFQEDQAKLHKSYAPDGVPRIMFAGEANHPVYIGTVHGAYETGTEAAQTVIGLHHKKK